jgi:hypothetical protein
MISVRLLQFSTAVQNEQRWQRKRSEALIRQSSVGRTFHKTLLQVLHVRGKGQNFASVAWVQFWYLLSLS